MDISTGTRKLEDRARDILKGIGLQPNLATISYVTAQLASIVEYSLDFAIYTLKQEGLLKEVEKSSVIQNPAAPISRR